MKLLVTGASSFLGKNLMPKLKEQNLKLLTPSSKELDMTNLKDVIDYWSSHKPDMVLHLAALCGGILANRNAPADFLHVNLKMGSNLYSAAKQFKTEYVYTLGSVCAYPLNCPMPFKEEDLWNGYPEFTNAGYGVSKRVLLLFGQTYRTQYGIRGAHLVPINMYAPHDHFNTTTSHVIPALIMKILDAVNNNKPSVEIWGTGNARRSFLYAEDCADAIVEMVSRRLDYDQPINLGPRTDISIKELAELIAKLCGYKGDLFFNPNYPDGQPKRILDISRAKEVLGWEPKTSLLEGLVRTIDWFQNQ